MSNSAPPLALLDTRRSLPAAEREQHLNRVFFALSDPVRRAILERLHGGRGLLVSELAAPFAISLQAISRHIQALVRAGLVQQERSGRISRCRLDVGPLFDAAVWLNRYSKHWQDEFNLLALTLEQLAPQKTASRAKASTSREPSGAKPRAMPRAWRPRYRY